MKTIPLVRGREAIVSDEDYEYLSQWTWGLVQNRYAARWENNTHIRMHVVIAKRMGLDTRHEIDHKDRDTFNNQRQNLRPATKLDNSRNRGPNKNNTSGFKGVRLEAGKWRAQIRVSKKRIHLGRFATAVLAAEAYNKAAKKYFGEFAYLNPIPAV